MNQLQRGEHQADFHSAQWDHDTPLSGAQLGVIGTAAQ
jgi:cation diffusion facilitator CzcD-associated flavoprotein CzcO